MTHIKLVDKLVNGGLVAAQILGHCRHLGGRLKKLLGQDCAGTAVTL